jgi:hypothetical protein
MVPVLILLAALLVGVVLAVALSSGGSSNSSGGHAKRHSARPGTKTHGTGKSSTSSGSHSTSTSTPASSTQTASTPTTSSSTTPSTSTATTPSTSSGGAASGVGPGAPTPTSAVQSFYKAAAAHRYSEAWALADPNLRSQLGGYSSFQKQFSSVRSITFHKAQTAGGSSSDSATVMVQTTSVQDSGTQQCEGAVRTARSGQGWLLDRVAINCS